MGTLKQTKKLYQRKPGAARKFTLLDVKNRSRENGPWPCTSIPLPPHPSILLQPRAGGSQMQF